MANFRLSYQNFFHGVAASSLFHSINILNRSEKKQYPSLVTEILGPSLNNNSQNQGKNLRRLLEGKSIKVEKKVAVRHGVVNNTIDSRRNNNYRPDCVEELTNYLKAKKQHILAIVYCRRESMPDLFSQLHCNGMLIIPAIKC